MVIGLPLLFLIIGLWCVLYFKVLRKQPLERQPLQGATLIIHKVDREATTLDSSFPNYQEILGRTENIINNSILVPRERQILIKLLVDPTTFPKEMEESDYIEIQPRERLKVEGQESEYDKLRFVLSGHYEGIIFLHAAPPRGYWGGWSPSDEKELWSLREFLDLPPRPAAATPVLQRITAPVSPQQTTESLNLNHGEVLQKLGIKAFSFYKEYTANPNTFDPDQLTLYPEVCRKGGYDLSPYLGQDLTFTGYRTDITYEEEPLDVWVVSSDSKIVCIYLSVREDSTMAPGIFSVNDPFLKLPSK